MRIYEVELIRIIESQLKNAEDGIRPYDLARDIYDAIFETLNDIYSEGYSDGEYERLG